MLKGLETLNDTTAPTQDTRRRRRGFRPLNTLASPQKSAAFRKQEHSPNSTLGEDSSLFEEENTAESSAFALKTHKMVKERSPSRSSSSQPAPPPPQQSQRLPLANISAKMQSQSPKQSQEGGSGAQFKQPSAPEFGQASPLRNPLTKPEASVFVPRQQKPVYKPLAQNQQYSQQAARAQQSQAHAAPMPPPEQRAFYVPGQRHAAPAPAPQYSSAMAAANALSSQPYQRSFDPYATHVPPPTNAHLPSVRPPPQPTFTSIGPNTHYQPFVQPRNVVDLMKKSDDDDGFDPDAAVHAGGRGFGNADPYSYVDSGRANENIKNLLEGAFDDDEDKAKVRLRKRAKKAMDAGKQKEAKGLADKLAALNVKEEPEAKAEPEAEEEDDDEEDGTVEGLSVKLLPHQVDGVSWMIDKEIGMRKKNGVLPYGGILADDMGLGKTVQTIALLLTNARPEPDAKPEHPKQKLPGKEVGKGTLVVAPLALIKQWEDEIKTKVSKSHAMRVRVHHGASRTKLAAELKKYDVVITTYQTLTSEHAGSNLNSTEGARIGCFGVHWYRIILDEAHSIKNRNAKSTIAACALNSWFRWCLTGTPMQNNLDELQSLIKFLRIKPYCELPQWKAQITQPMKNGRGTMAMRRLNAFLHAFMKRRTKDILKQEGALNFGGKKEKDGEKKGGMQIVKREIVSVDCVFDGAETEFYNRLQDRTDKRLQDMAKEGGKTDYIGALVLLLRLRQACNHPQLVEKSINKDKDAMTTGNSGGTQTPGKPSGGDDMDDLAAMMGGVTVQTKHCDICQVEMTAAESKADAVRCGECEADLAAVKRARKKGKKQKNDKKEAKQEVKQEVKQEKRSRNKRVVEDSDDEEDEGEWIGKGPEEKIDLGKAGGSDDEDADGGGETLDSIDSQRSASDDADEVDSPSRARSRKPARHSVSDDNDSEIASSEDESDSESTPANLLNGLQKSGKPHSNPSTKIRHLLRILHTESPTHKTIVFSQFTTMLDLIEPHLRAKGFRFVRYDGSMRPDAREASLSALKNDPKCRVLLCSLKCGSLGLNLTAASRVVILEPFWNPFVEEQAIDRVHRLNQTVDVKVFRMVVDNTVETRIVDLQTRKRELAAAAIEGGAKAVGKLSMNEIFSLFRHDSGGGGPTSEDDGRLARLGGGSGGLFEPPSTGPEPNKKPVEGAAARREGKAVSSNAQRTREHEVYGRRW